MILLRSLIKKKSLTKVELSKEVCVICYSNNSTQIAVPCAHKIICDDCLQIFDIKTFEKCPLCRANIIYLLKMK